MTPQDIANLVDMLISIAGGVLATLYGFRIFGKPNPTYPRHEKWRWHLRWIGPVTIVLALARYIIALTMVN
jgi:hypothetical protein